MARHGRPQDVRCNRRAAYPYGPEKNGSRRHDLGRALSRFHDLDDPRRADEKPSYPYRSLGAGRTRIAAGFPRCGDAVFQGFNNFFAEKARLEAKAGVTNWHLHDLRRSVATGLQRLGVRLEVTEAVLNHTDSRAGIVGIYQRHDFAAEKRQALEAWSAHVLAIAEGRPVEENVVALRR
jgi:integrase